VGLDIGPQTIAIVAKAQQQGHLQVFADALKEHRQKKVQLQRKLSRQLRANNPSSFAADRWQKSDKHWRKKQGKVIRGKRFTKRSAALQATSDQLADLQRREAAYRKAQHGQLVNQILQIGSHIKTEKLSYRSFQKLYGKSVGMRAPGKFVSMLSRKAENAGGQLDQINTWKTKLSQSCHCGQVKKKPLSERWHRCSCGVAAQRDLYSAYLACYVEKDVLMADQAQAAWSGMDIALRTAMKQIKQPIGGPMPASLGMNSGQRLSCALCPKLS
jgi:transposase